MFADKQSGKDFDRPAYNELMARLGSGDTLVVKIRSLALIQRHMAMKGLKPLDIWVCTAFHSAKAGLEGRFSLFARVERAFKKAKPKYHPTRFIEMLHVYGAVGASKRLLQDGKESSEYKGLTRLWQMEYCENIPNSLHCSVEAIIYEDEEYGPLFSAAEREVCKKRLTELGFFK